MATQQIEGVSSATNASTSQPQPPLPDGFVYLSDINSDIVQALRYTGPENVLGRPLNGYKANKVIVTRALALKLDAIQKKLQRDFNLCLVVYDAYRPRKAVEDFWQWAHLPPLAAQEDMVANSGGTSAVRESGTYDPDAMALKYFPKFRGNTTTLDLANMSLNNNSFNRMVATQTRATLFEKNYISKRSNHARGSTVDVTIVQWDRRDEVRVDKLIPVVNRSGILHFRDLEPMTPSKSVCNTLDTSSQRGKLVHLPEFRAYDQLIREFVIPKLSDAQTSYINTLEREVMDAAHNAADRLRGESVDGYAKALDRYGPLPFIDDRTVDMGTSFDLFDLASHPLWPGHFSQHGFEGLQPSRRPSSSGSRTASTNGVGISLGCSPSSTSQLQQRVLGQGPFSSANNMSFGTTPPSLGSSMIRHQQQQLRTVESSDMILKTTTHRVDALPQAVLSHPTYLLRRLFLQCLFEEEGFEISEEEWWHFWLKDGEPFPPREDEPEFGFNFDIE